MLRRVMLLVAVLGLTAGCRLAGGAPPSQEAMARSQEAVTPSGSGLYGDGRCFGPEIALEYAGRSTTAELGVQEVVGDPMSSHPADIYITRDKFQEGSQYGRLVCAIYVEDGDFIEVTVHPEDGGRFSPAPPTPTPTPLPSGFIQIFTHCGLDDPRIEYGGELWRFDVEDQANSPDGWGSDFPVVQIRPGPEGPIVTAPDGSEWQLVPADPNDAPGGCL